MKLKITAILLALALMTTTVSSSIAADTNSPAATPAPAPSAAAPAAPEAKPEDPMIEYITYIAKPAPDVWKAITDKAIIDQYYMVPVVKLEPKEGGEISYGAGVNKVMISGKVVEFTPPGETKAGRFVHTFNASWNHPPIPKPPLHTLLSR